MGPTIRYRDVCVGVFEELCPRLQILFGVAWWDPEGGLQALVQGQVQEGVQGVCPGHGRQRLDGHALVVVVPCVDHFQDPHPAPIGPDIGPLLHIPLHGGAHRGVAQFGRALLIRMFSSLSSGLVGAKPKPHWPIVSEVTPNQPDSEA